MAAMGGVGRAATQLALSLGAAVVGSCRGALMDEARPLGVNRVVDLQQFSAGRLQGQFDVVFDTATRWVSACGRSPSNLLPVTGQLERVR